MTLLAVLFIALILLLTIDRARLLAAWWRALAPLVLLIAFGLPGLALAATPTATVTLDLAPMLNQIVAPFLTAVLLALASWAMAKAAAYFHIQVQASQRELVNDAIGKAIAYAEQMLGGKAQAPVNDKVAAAVNYLLPKIPDALKGLGITPEHLAQLVTARLGPPS